jgi:hypothetical protein
MGRSIISRLSSSGLAIIFTILREGGAAKGGAATGDAATAVRRSLQGVGQPGGRSLIEGGGSGKGKEPGLLAMTPHNGRQLRCLFFVPFIEKSLGFGPCGGAVFVRVQYRLIRAQAVDIDRRCPTLCNISPIRS